MVGADVSPREHCSTFAICICPISQDLVHIDRCAPGDVERFALERQRMASSVGLSIRPSLRQPSSPHTPNRLISSNISSPGSGFRQEEDAVIIELGSRYLRAGFEGEHSPQCVVTFGPEDSRREGDYRGWAPGGRRKDLNIEKWGQAHELWRMDLRDVDLGLVEDKIERAVREIHNNHLLTDIGSARLVLVLPSILPLPLLSTAITTLFARWKYSSITLLPSPIAAAVGAGVRSALVVDIGWSETIITAIDEYREIGTKRSTRATQCLLKELGRSLISHQHGSSNEGLDVDFELAEELMARMAWCNQQDKGSVDGGPINDGETQGNSSRSGHIEDQEVQIDWPTGLSSKLVTIPFTVFSKPVQKVFLASDTDSQPPDDHEHSLPELMYETLQAVPRDSRAMCMSRIVFVGGGSGIPGLAQRSIAEVDALINRYGWSTVRGKRAESRRTMLGDMRQGRTEKPAARSSEALSAGEDYVEEQLQKQRAKNALPSLQGKLRQVESLGAWAGASLLTSMKIKGVVEIERERFLQHGLASANPNMNVSLVSQRSNFGTANGVSRAAGDRRSWTLAGWG